MEDLVNKVSDIANILDSLTKRIEQIELDRKTKEDSSSSVETEQQFHSQNQNGAGLSPRVVDAGASDTDIQREFDCVKDSLSKVQISKKYKVFDSSKGVTKENKNTLAVVSKCARFSETGLKVFASLDCIDSESSSDDVLVHKEDLQKLFTIFAAQCNYLQGEYANIIVKSNFDEDTSRIFRSFENNSAAFSDQSLKNIRIAAELASIPRPSGRSRYQGFSRGFGFSNRGFRGGRGFRHPGGQGGYHNFNFPHRPADE